MLDSRMQTTLMEVSFFVAEDARRRLQPSTSADGDAF